MKNTTHKPASSILYEGPSMIDGKPIVVIATVGSANSKTGAMVQTWIMRQDVEPHHALKTGKPDRMRACAGIVRTVPLMVAPVMSPCFRLRLAYTGRGNVADTSTRRRDSMLA
jgi:hypothetical protein